jgi:hypothetical protein
MVRLRTIGLAIAVLLVVGITALLIALPALLRQNAVTQLSRMTGRAVALERVRLNVFTGRLGLERFRLAQRGSTDPAVEVEGLEAHVSVPSLFTNRIRVKSLTVTAPRVHVARLSETEFDFSDLLALVPPPDPNAKPSRRSVAIERFVMTGGAVVAGGNVARTTVTLDTIDVDGTALTTAGPPGRLTLRAKLNGKPLAMNATVVDLATGALNGRLTLEAFDFALGRRYIPPSVGIVPSAGHVTLALDVKVAPRATREAAPAGPPRVTVSGDVRVEGFALHMKDVDDPFLKLGRAVATIKNAQPFDGILELDTVTIDTVDVRVKRDAQGAIDLVAIAQPPAAAPAASATASMPAPTTAVAPATRPLNVKVRELALRGTTVTLRDETVKTTLALTDVNATVRDLAWPGGTPLTFAVGIGMPGAGRLDVKGNATLAPVTAEFTMSMRGAPIAPYQPYIPIPGRIVGTFNGESRNRIALTDGKLALAVSQGKSWIEGLELRDPGGTTAPVKISRVMIDGIDFSHPGKAKARIITVTKPQARIERDAGGEINVRRLFAAATPPMTATKAEPRSAAARVAPAAESAPAAAPFTTPFPLEIGSIVIEDGDARFLDRTTTPAFSETITRLAVKVDNLSSEPGRRAQVAVQALVGQDSALDLKGELTPFGDLYANVSGELRRFALPAVNPYAENMIAWIIQRGTLTAKLHYTVERDRFTAQNEIIVENLHVARSGGEDEVQKRVGVPLGLIVALVTDADNSIRVKFPVEGTFESFTADLSDAIWTVVKNVVTNIVAAPFRAIGRMFKGKGDTIESLTVDPAPFPEGSATLAAESEGHLTKVGDFLRRAPGVTLTLAPVTTPADGETLRTQQLAVRLQRLQREKNLPTLEAAIADEFKRVFQGEAVPKSVDEQLARLQERETVAPEAVEQLAKQRLEAVREALATREGIPATRLVAGAPKAESSGGGRVEFSIGSATAGAASPATGGVGGTASPATEPAGTASPPSGVVTDAPAKEPATR